MAIGSISNSISRFSSAVTQRVVNVVPQMTVSNEKALNSLKWIGEKVSSPQNRLILGVTALMSQPFIDLSNKKVDEDTRKVSAARTVAKIIAGTLTGVAIRSGCIHAIDAFTKLPTQITPDMKFRKLRTLFTPTAAMQGFLEDLSQYKKSFGTIFSLFVMVFTNFLIDAPLTKFLTNKFVDRINDKKQQDLALANSKFADSKTETLKTKEVRHE